ncbi:MAG: hypothetical protein IJP33_00710 [Firmicutes bacterium]|nr:hypothetical protein [Bacillota bacterium]
MEDINKAVDIIDEPQKANELIALLKRLEQQIEAHRHLNNSKKKFYMKEIRVALEWYDGIVIPSYQKEQYNSLLKNGEELLRELKRSNQFTALEGKIAYYLRYIIASTYDFKNDIKGMNHYTRFFIVAAAGFMLLTPQFYGFILPLIFFIPMFIGLKGLRRRSRTGLFMSMAVLPMAFLSGITYISWAMRTAIPDYAGTLASICSTYNVAETLGNIWIIGFGVLAPVVAVSSLIATYYGIKYYRLYI